MTATEKSREGGRFDELRSKHLPLFEEAVKRHDRGWPHRVEEGAEGETARRSWKTVGIVHFRPDESGEG